jgi:hypothetical protein
VYSSSGNGSNSLEVSGAEFGLYSYDEVDALAVIDQAPKYYGTSSSCDLTPSPLDAEGAGLSNFSSVHGLGRNLILVAGSQTVSEEDTISAIAAYDLKTCTFVARAALGNAALTAGWVAVPLPGWNPTAPLEKLEYWVSDSVGEEGALVLHRLDAAGQLLNSYGFSNLADAQGSGFSGATLEYDASHDRLIGVLAPRSNPADYQRIVFPRPASAAATDTLLEVYNSPLPHPCANAPEFSGVDADGNSYFAQWDRTTYATYRVCPLTPTGEFSDLPFSVSVSTIHTFDGMIVPGDAIYGLIQHPAAGKAGGISFELARQALTP